MTLNYEPRAQNHPQAPLSRLAPLALVVGLLSFPLLPHWTIYALLVDLGRALSVPRHVFLNAVAYAWNLLGAVICLIALVRIRAFRGKLRGGALAAAGLIVSL